MKKLLLFMLLVEYAVFNVYAQSLDPSQWEIGDDISETVGFGNLSFENDPMDFWQVDCTKGNPNTTGGLFELYDGSGDVYQYLYLPAGVYELNCQGYYRFGNSWDVDPNAYANNTWKNLSLLYATAGTYDIDSQEFAASGTTFSNPLMPRLYEEVYERLYLGPQEGEDGYSGWDMSDQPYNQVDGRCGPCSIPGSLVWFASNKYLPFESDVDETVYNKVIFFVTEPSWVKVGVQKIELETADSFIVTNFHLIYKGDCISTKTIEGVEMSFYMIDNIEKTVQVGIDGNTAISKNYSGAVTIPSSIMYDNDEYTVTDIGKAAFIHCEGLTTVKIPQTVENIRSQAFMGCIGLTSIEIPSSVKRINSCAFKDCTNLTNINVSNNVSKIGGYVFDNTEWYNSLGNGVIYINNVVYKYKGTMHESTNVVIKEGTISIADIAFYGCKDLISIEVPNSVTSIGYDAFWDCTNLKSITVHSNIPPITNHAIVSNDVYNHCTLYVPSGSVTTYREAELWGRFKNIETIKYQVVYYVDGIEYKTELLEPGAPLQPEMLSREGYSFSGWSDYPETMPDHDIIISGSFIINKYKVTYIVDDTDYKTEEVEYGSTLKPNTPTKEGYTFSGWIGLPKTMPAHDVTVTGTFYVNNYILTYKVDGKGYKSYSISYGTAITPETEPTKEGYTFSGWSEIPTTMPAHDVTITGTFSVNSYNISYVVDGKEYKTETIEYGTVLKPDVLVKEGYSFEWIDLPETMPAHDVVVTGCFVINKYKMTYIVDGIEYKTIEVDYGTNINPVDEPTKTGYTFSGWSEIPAEMPAHDVIVNGSFSVNSYRLSYIVNDKVYETDSIAYGTEAIPIEGPEMEGYTFIGWTGFPTTMPAYDVIVVGFYTANSYKVTFMYGDNVLTTIDVDYGAVIPLPESLNSERYTLIEWLDVPETMPARDIIIYADYVDGIDTITADSKDVQYIQMNGMYTNEMKKGLNIIRMNDGTTKKVWVK